MTSEFLTDDLLTKVHARLRLGVDLVTFTDGTVEARWKRDYDGEWSDERFSSAPSLTGVLQQILDYEDRADGGEASEKCDCEWESSPPHVCDFCGAVPA